MAESIVRVPKDSSMDYDYIAFSFKGKHSFEDFGIYRTSDGDRYNEELMPTAQDVTAEVPNGDGMYYFDTKHKQKVFNISFAFEGLAEQTLREMKKWLNSKETGDLWFAENPYKVYTAKVTGQPTIKYIPLDTRDANRNVTGRAYNGEGTIQFTCYWPYAHTPDFVDNNSKNGKSLTSYNGFGNVDYWSAASGLVEGGGACTGENPGDVPAPFKVIKTGKVDAGTEFTVGTLSVKTKSACYDFEWDSKTGLVIAASTSGGTKSPIDFTGNSCGAIPVGGTSNIKIGSGAKLQYHYWYY